MKNIFKFIDAFCSGAGLMGAILMCCSILINYDVTRGFCIYTLINVVISFITMFFRDSLYNKKLTIS